MRATPPRLRSAVRARARGGLAFAFVAALGALPSCAGCGDAGRPAFEATASDAEAGPAQPLPPAEGGGPLTTCEEATARGAPLGCDYLIFSVPDGSYPNAGCTAVLVSNPGERPARIEVLRDGKVADIADAAHIVLPASNGPSYAPVVGGELPPGASIAIALVQGSLAQFPATESWGECPFPAIVDEGHVGLHDVSDVLGFHVRSSEPVFATYFHPYAFGWTFNVFTSSTALRSAGSWDTRNVDLGVFMPGRPTVQHEREGNPIYDDMAGFVALGSSSDARVSMIGPDGPSTVDVRAGHVVRVRRDDLFIGSRIESDVPVAAFVGTRLSFLPYDTGGADPLLNQVPPPRAWASEYAAVRYPNRYEDVPDVAIYRFVADKDGTTLSYEPSRPDGAPEKLDAGQLGVFLTGDSFVVRSQDQAHPFYASVAMTSYERIQPEREWDSGIQGRGDPELVGLVPRKEFANRFAFVTDQYPDVHLVLVRAKESGIFHDVTLGCAGTVTGWKPLGSGDTYETTSVTLSAGKFEPQVYPGGTCRNGPHTIQSDGPFTGYVWGWGHEGAIDLQPPRDGGGVSFGFALYGLTTGIPGAGH